ncbi:DUF421 domain-containing protein [Glaciimonas immobilis]|uniref:Uncharacterized membrane protein YcaP (DUF421 family) n=1 Tax=Glaciimonas immobilis TaxID=728004 RepID=A0A840RQX0_9BURK|nr:YetF domain-containing protein [Glaciimonas immobilis]KAF3997826.1 DUF421 domain-containing protein [Glaciimonas immobilis]MBB5199542.1 uncharacterized membrane protein YcaP (DUF421 family) [Glaciimonas immobilis]
MALWRTLFGITGDPSILQMSLRALIVFILTLVLLRVGGRRSLGHRSAFDLCITVLLGAVLSRAIVGASPFFSTLCAGTTIVVLHRIIGLLSIWSPLFDKIVSGSARILVTDGIIDRHQMRAGLITDTDLREAVNKKMGTTDIKEVTKVVLERNGELSVFAKPDPNAPKPP